MTEEAWIDGVSQLTPAEWFFLARRGSLPFDPRMNEDKISDWEKRGEKHLERLERLGLLERGVGVTETGAALLGLRWGHSGCAEGML